MQKRATRRKRGVIDRISLPTPGTAAYMSGEGAVKLGRDRSLTIISAMRSAGGGEFDGDEAIVRLYSGQE
jgi:hypothetical protein